MAQATQRRQSGVMGALGKHDREQSWREDFRDGRTVLLPGPRTAWRGVSGGSPSCLPQGSLGWHQTGGRKPTSGGGGLASCSGISSPHSLPSLKPVGGREGFQGVSLQGLALRLAFSYTALVHGIAGSGGLTHMSPIHGTSAESCGSQTWLLRHTAAAGRGGLRPTSIWLQDSALGC